MTRVSACEVTSLRNARTIVEAPWLVKNFLQEILLGGYPLLHTRDCRGAPSKSRTQMWPRASRKHRSASRQISVDIASQRLYRSGRFMFPANGRPGFLSRDTAERLALSGTSYSLPITSSHTAQAPAEFHNVLVSPPDDMPMTKNRRVDSFTSIPPSLEFQRSQRTSHELFV